MQVKQKVLDLVKERDKLAQVEPEYQMPTSYDEPTARQKKYEVLDARYEVRSSG